MNDIKQAGQSIRFDEDKRDRMWFLHNEGYVPEETSEQWVRWKKARAGYSKKFDPTKIYSVEEAVKLFPSDVNYALLETEEQKRYRLVKEEREAERQQLLALKALEIKQKVSTLVVDTAALVEGIKIEGTEMTIADFVRALEKGQKTAVPDYMTKGSVYPIARQNGIKIKTKNEDGVMFVTRLS